MKCFYSDTFVLPLPEHHRFPMAKYRLLRERLLAERIVSAAELHVADPVTIEELRLAHDADYVDAVISGTISPEMQRRIGFPWSAMMVERSRRSAGATLAAARTAIAAVGAGLKACATAKACATDKACAANVARGLIDVAQGFSPAIPDVSSAIAANLAGGTHHAFADRGEGYCVFNDVAIAARVLQRTGPIGRALVIDCDVHQGNGTASIFRNDASVFTLSFHGDKNFPFRKEVSDRDVTFDDGTGDDEYLRALEHHVPDVLDDQQPDIVFYLAGADPYEGDRLGRLKLTIDGLRARDRFVLGQCRARDLPVAIAMSGGYAPDVDAIVTIHTNTIREAVALCRSVSVF